MHSASCKCQSQVWIPRWLQILILPGTSGQEEPPRGMSTPKFPFLFPFSKTQRLEIMLFGQKCSKLKLIHRNTINLDRILNLVAYEIGTLDQFQHLCNFTLTPPLTREQSTDIKFGLLLGEGRGRCVVSQIMRLIRNPHLKILRAWYIFDRRQSEGFVSSDMRQNVC